MSNLPPMSVRNFRDYFMIEDEPASEYRGLATDRTPIRYDPDPYERCDFEEDGGDDE